MSIFDSIKVKKPFGADAPTANTSPYIPEANMSMAYVPEQNMSLKETKSQFVARGAKELYGTAKRAVNDLGNAVVSGVKDIDAEIIKKQDAYAKTTDNKLKRALYNTTVPIQEGAKFGVSAIGSATETLYGIGKGAVKLVRDVTPPAPKFISDSLVKNRLTLAELEDKAYYAYKEAYGLAQKKVPEYFDDGRNIHLKEGSLADMTGTVVAYSLASPTRPLLGVSKASNPVVRFFGNTARGIGTEMIESIPTDNLYSYGKYNRFQNFEENFLSTVFSPISGVAHGVSRLASPNIKNTINNEKAELITQATKDVSNSITTNGTDVSFILDNLIGDNNVKSARIGVDDIDIITDSGRIYTDGDTIKYSKIGDTGEFLPPEVLLEGNKIDNIKGISDAMYTKYSNMVEIDKRMPITEADIYGPKEFNTGGIDIEADSQGLRDMYTEGIAHAKIEADDIDLAIDEVSRIEAYKKDTSSYKRLISRLNTPEIDDLRSRYAPAGDAVLDIDGYVFDAVSKRNVIQVPTIEYLNSIYGVANSAKTKAFITLKGMMKGFTRKEEFAGQDLYEASKISGRAFYKDYIKASTDIKNGNYDPSNPMHRASSIWEVPEAFSASAYMENVPVEDLFDIKEEMGKLGLLNSFDEYINKNGVSDEYANMDKTSIERALLPVYIKGLSDSIMNAGEVSGIDLKKVELYNYISKQYILWYNSKIPEHPHLANHQLMSFQIDGIKDGQYIKNNKDLILTPFTKEIYLRPNEIETSMVKVALDKKISADYTGEDTVQKYDDVYKEINFYNLPLLMRSLKERNLPINIDAYRSDIISMLRYYNPLKDAEELGMPVEGVKKINEWDAYLVSHGLPSLGEIKELGYVNDRPAIPKKLAIHLDKVWRGSLNKDVALYGDINSRIYDFIEGKMEYAMQPLNNSTISKNWRMPARIDTPRGVSGDGINSISIPRDYATLMDKVNMLNDDTSALAVARKIGNLNNRFDNVIDNMRNRLSTEGYSKKEASLILSQFKRIIRPVTSKFSKINQLEDAVNTVNSVVTLAYNPLSMVLDEFVKTSMGTVANIFGDFTETMRALRTMAFRDDVEYPGYKITSQDLDAYVSDRFGKNSVLDTSIVVSALKNGDGVDNHIIFSMYKEKYGDIALDMAKNRSIMDKAFAYASRVSSRSFIDEDIGFVKEYGGLDPLRTSIISNFDTFTGSRSFTDMMKDPAIPTIAKIKNVVMNGAGYALHVISLATLSPAIFVTRLIPLLHELNQRTIIKRAKRLYDAGDSAYFQRFGIDINKTSRVNAVRALTEISDDIVKSAPKTRSAGIGDLTPEDPALRAISHLTWLKFSNYLNGQANSISFMYKSLPNPSGKQRAVLTAGAVMAGVFILYQFADRDAIERDKKYKMSYNLLSRAMPQMTGIEKGDEGYEEQQKMIMAILRAVDFISPFVDFFTQKTGLSVAYQPEEIKDLGKEMGMQAITGLIGSFSILPMVPSKLNKVADALANIFSSGDDTPPIISISDSPDKKTLTNIISGLAIDELSKNKNALEDGSIRDIAMMAGGVVDPKSFDESEFNKEKNKDDKGFNRSVPKYSVIASKVLKAESKKSGLAPYPFIKKRLLEKGLEPSLDNVISYMKTIGVRGEPAREVLDDFAKRNKYSDFDEFIVSNPNIKRKISLALYANGVIDKKKLEKYMDKKGFKIPEEIARKRRIGIIEDRIPEKGKKTMSSLMSFVEKKYKEGTKTGNCVQFVRLIHKDLPGGLYTIEDKIRLLVNDKKRGIRKDQFVKIAMPGDVIVERTGQAPGHVAIVKSVDKDKGTITITESNYYIKRDGPNKVTHTRVIPINSPSIVGAWR